MTGKPWFIQGINTSGYPKYLTPENEWVFGMNLHKARQFKTKEDAEREIATIEQPQPRIVSITAVQKQVMP